MISPEERQFFYFGLASAKRYGLEWEYITFYKRARRNGDSIVNSAWYAMCEWDL